MNFEEEERKRVTAEAEEAEENVRERERREKAERDSKEPGAIAIGIFTNVSHKQYHDLPLEIVSNSYLGELSKCPAAARIVKPTTPAMIMGQAFHCLLLDGEEMFNNEFAVAPVVDRRTKAGKEIWADFILEHPDKAIIDAEDRDKLYNMGNAVIRHPFAVKLLAEGRSEVSIFWKDKGTGADCKVRPDRIPAGDRGTIVDVKTVMSASEAAFTSACVRYGYFRQAGMYTIGYNAVTNGNVDQFAFICVEKEDPYRVEVHTLDDAAIDYGKGEYHRLLHIENECREKNYWPHYQNAGASVIYLPKYLDIYNA
jgi:hypothetical protein